MVEFGERLECGLGELAGCVSEALRETCGFRVEQKIREVETSGSWSRKARRSLKSVWEEENFRSVVTIVVLKHCIRFWVIRD